MPRSDRQHGRKHAGSRVNDPAGVGVVEIEPMDQDAVHQRRVARRRPCRHADHGSVSGSGKAGDRDERAAGEIVGGRRERDPDRIEDQMLGAREHGHRNRIGGNCADETRELLGDQRLRGIRLRFARYKCDAGRSLRAHRFLLCRPRARSERWFGA